MKVTIGSSLIPDIDLAIALDTQKEHQEDSPSLKSIMFLLCQARTLNCQLLNRSIVFHTSRNRFSAGSPRPVPIVGVSAIDQEDCKSRARRPCMGAASLALDKKQLSKQMDDIMGERCGCGQLETELISGGKGKGQVFFLNWDLGKHRKWPHSTASASACFWALRQVVVLVSSPPASEFGDCMYLDISLVSRLIQVVLACLHLPSAL